MYLGILLVIILGWYVYSSMASGESSSNEEKTYVINMVTGEFKSETADGKEIEAYRWDPGTIFVPEGEKVQLRIYGVNGEEHPFIIEGTDIKGTVKKGEETVLNLRFNEEGIYRLICLTHPDIKSNGPMIAYIVVD
ncbi:MAG: cupredoxin domain-containing protein [Bacillaceae bacterium]|nr:cupredoxin domain-containing protein [Bacillaceae bacterium]